MPSIEASLHDTSILLKIGHLELEERDDALSEVLGELLPIMSKILEIEILWQSLKHEERVLLIRSHLAMSMKVRGRLAAALKEAENHFFVISGVECISDHGFPEFANGESHDV